MGLCFLAHGSSIHKRYNDRLHLTRRRHRNRGYLKETTELGFRGSALIKGFHSMQWSNGKQCWLLVAMGGGRGGLGFWVLVEGLGRRGVELFVSLVLPTCKQRQTIKNILGKIFISSRLPKDSSLKSPRKKTFHIFIGIKIQGRKKST